VHCGTTDADTLERAAAAFGLAAEAGIYREVGRDVARDLVAELLHRDLAYAYPIMSLERARDLADRFLLELNSESCRFFTNVAAPLEPVASGARLSVKPS
jgi:hypothetical protein